MAVERPTIPSYVGKPVKNFEGVYNTDTGVLSLSWEKPDTVYNILGSDALTGYVVLYRVGGRVAMVPPFGAVTSWEEYYDMEVLEKVGSDKTSVDIEISLEEERYAIGIYPTYKITFTEPAGAPERYDSISKSGLITLLDIDFFVGGSIEGLVARPQRLYADSEGNLYFNNSFVRDINEDPLYFITSKIDTRNNVTGIEADLDTLTLLNTGRVPFSVYCEFNNSVFTIYDGAVTQYKIDNEEYVSLYSNGPDGGNNQRVLYLRNIIAADNETGYIYLEADAQNTNGWAGIWEIRPDLEISDKMINQGGTANTLNATDVKFTNTIYQDDMILGQLISSSPGTSGAAIVIDKDETSFTVRFASGLTQNLSGHIRSNYILVRGKIGDRGSAGTEWYEQNKPYNISTRWGFIEDGTLYFPQLGGPFNLEDEFPDTQLKAINLTTKETADVGALLSGMLAVTRVPDGTIFVSNLSAVYSYDSETGLWDLHAGQATVSSTPVNGTGAEASFAGIRGIVYSPFDQYLYVSDYHSTENVIETSNIRRISADGVVSDKDAIVQNEDELENTEEEVSTNGEDTDQTIGMADYTVDYDATNDTVSFYDPNNNLITFIPLEGSAPGDVITVRKTTGSLQILQNGEIIYTYLLSPVEIATQFSDYYIGWYTYQTKTPTTTPEGAVQQAPLNGYNYILKTTFEERLGALESPFYYGRNFYGKAFLLFEDGSYVYDRHVLDDDYSRATYKIMGGRRYYYTDTEYLESPILPDYIVDFIASTPLRQYLIEVNI